MQLRSGTIIEVVSNESNNFEVNPSEGDGLKQSTASDGSGSMPFYEDDGDQLPSIHNNIDHILPDSVKSTNKSLWNLSEPIRDWTDKEVLDRAAHLVSLAGLDVPIKAEPEDDDYWESQRTIVSDYWSNDSSDDERHTSELLLQSDAWASAVDERDLDQRSLMDVPGMLEAEMDGNPAKRRKLISASNTSLSLIN